MYIPKRIQMAARFEYRVFHQNLNVAKAYLQNHYESKGEKKSQETYLLDKDIDELNIKIRQHQLDVKRLKGCENGFEQWELFYKKPFPIDAKHINNLFNKKLVQPDTLVSEATLKKSLKSHAHMKYIRLHKKRFFFQLAQIQAEFAKIQIANKTFHTVALESSNLKKLQKAVHDIKLNTFLNTNYYAFLKSVCLEAETKY